MNIIDRFLGYLLEEKQYSKLTVRAYSDDICQFLSYIGVTSDNFVIGDVKTIELRSYIMSLSQSGLKHSTINRKVSSLKSLFAYSHRVGVIAVNPTIHLTQLKVERRLPAFVPLSIMADNQDNLLEITSDFLRERDSLIILLFYATGIRVSELIDIKVSDISFDNLEIRVLGKGNKVRIVPIHHLLIEKIKNFVNICQKILKIENNLLILSKKGCKASRSDVYRVVNQQLTIMGVEGKRSPHVLRHTFATHLLNNGAGIETVKELLGHANLSATQIYTHNNIGVLKEKYGVAHPRAIKE